MIDRLNGEIVRTVSILYDIADKYEGLSYHDQMGREKEIVDLLIEEKFLGMNEKGELMIM